MNVVLKTLMLSLLLVMGAGTGVAQGYRGLVPLRSGCEDVKRTLGVKRCDYPDSKYEFEDETVRVTFSTKRCDKAWGKAWNVPRGTVLAIERVFRKPLPLSESQIDLSKYKEAGRAKDIDESEYINEVDGMLLLIVEKDIRSIDYAPPGTNEHLVCPSVPDPAAILNNLVTKSTWFDRYQNLPYSKEKKRLDNLAKKLKEQPQTSQVYFVVYNDRKNSNRSVIARAERARYYLTRNYGIDVNRIEIISGGKSKGYTTVIYVVPLEQSQRKSAMGR